MPYTKNTWTDRTVERPLTYTMQTNADGSTTLIPAEGTIITPGTPITADKLNQLETQYEQAYNPENLTSDSSSKVYTEATPGGDANALAQKLQGMRGSNTGTNLPTNYTSIFNIPLGTNSDMQLAGTYTGENNFYLRGRHDIEASWNKWEKVITLDSAGSNSNGDWMRFSNGLQICWLYHLKPCNSFAWSTVTLQGQIYYYTGGNTWIFPSTFLISKPLSVSLSGDVPVACLEVHNVYNSTSTQCTYEHGCNNSTVTTLASNMVRQFLAIGYWK
jgi:hypothetical protein